MQLHIHPAESRTKALERQDTFKATQLSDSATPLLLCMLRTGCRQAAVTAKQLSFVRQRGALAAATLFPEVWL